MEIKQEQRELISQLIEKGDRELYYIIGEMQGQDIIGGDYYRRGRKIIERVMGNFRLEICRNETIQKLRNNEEFDDKLLAGVVADVLAGALTGIAPVVAALLIVRRGLPELCSDVWIDDQEDK